MQITDELVNSLRAEVSGIFNWLFDGYRIVREQGGFSFDMDKMKAKERRLFKRKIVTVTEMLRKVFGNKEFHELERVGLIDALPEKIYREQNAFVERTVEKAREHSGGVRGWLMEGGQRVEEKGGAAYLASKLAGMTEDERENLMNQIAQFTEMIQGDLSQTPAERQEITRKMEEIKRLLQQ